MRVPRSVGEAKLEFARDSTADREPLSSERCQCAACTAELNDEGLAKGGFKTSAAASNRAMPARRLEAKRNRRCSLQECAAEHHRVQVLIG